MGHNQIVALREVFDGVQIFAAGAVAMGEFITSEIRSLRKRAGVEFLNRRGQGGEIVYGAQADGDAGDFGGIGGACCARVR